MGSISRSLGASAMALATLLVASGAAAQSYPARPVKIVVGFPAGGPTDVAARLVAQELSAVWPHNVIVENRVGASGTIGADAAAKSAPDGHTLLLATLVANATAPSVYAKLPYDPQRDFTYIVPLSKQLNMLLAHPSVPAGSLADLVSWTRANQGKIPYSSAGVGLSSHLGMEIVVQATGMQLLHVPYKGSAPATQAVVAGETLLSLDLVPSAIPHLRSGKPRGIAVASDKRAPQLPDVPTFAEIGGPTIEVYTWSGIAAPAGTPPDIVRRIHADVPSALREPEVRERMARLGMDPFEMSPEAFQQFVASEARKWGDVARRLSIKLD